MGWVMRLAVAAFSLQAGAALGGAALIAPTPQPPHPLLEYTSEIRGAVPIQGARDFLIRPGYTAGCRWITETALPRRGSKRTAWEVDIETHSASNGLRADYRASRRLSQSDDLGPVTLQYAGILDPHGAYLDFFFEGLVAARDTADPVRLRRMTERVRRSDLPDRFKAVFAMPIAGQQVRQDSKLIDDGTLLELAASIIGIRHPELRVRDIENQTRAGGIVRRGSEEYLVVEMLFEIRTASRRGEMWFRAEGYRLIHLDSGLLYEADETITTKSDRKDHGIVQKTRNRVSCDIRKRQQAVARRQRPQVLQPAPPRREPPAPSAEPSAQSSVRPANKAAVVSRNRWRVRGEPTPKVDAVAVIIGNKAYEGSIPAVDFAHNDADAVKRFVIDVLGTDPSNVIDVRDATKAQLEGVFGNERSHQGRLWRYLDPEGGSDVVIFYSGHGVPGLKDKRGYLLPVNGEPDLAEINGYPVDVLYANLAKLSTRSVTVFLDACFSGETPKGMLIQATSGISIHPKLPEEISGLTVVTAAAGDQVASWDLDASHGLFTRHLLDALYGAADETPAGNGDRRVTLAEARIYLDRHMTRAARREYGREQKVTVQGADGAVLANLSGLSRLAASGEAMHAPSRETILEVQRSLSAAGYDPGAIDGQLGPSTQNAIVRYQSTQGLTVDGQVSNLLIESLHAKTK